MPRVRIDNLKTRLILFMVALGFLGLVELLHDFIR